MRTRLPILAVLALAALAAAPVAGESAIVVVAEDGGFPPAAVRTVRSLAATELRARGIGGSPLTRTAELGTPG